MRILYDSEHYWSKFGLLEKPQKTYFLSPFRKKVNFCEYLPPEDDVISIKSEDKFL